MMFYNVNVLNTLDNTPGTSPGTLFKSTKDTLAMPVAYFLIDAPPNAITSTALCCTYVMVRMCTVLYLAPLFR